METETIVKVGLLVLALQVAVEAKPTNPKIGMPAACNNMSYCTEKHKDYPQDVINELLRNANLTFASKLQADLGLRTDTGDDERDCKVDIPVERIIYEIVDSEENTRVVVQSDAGFKQEFRIERCLKPGRILSMTRHFNDDVLSSYNFQCVEKTLEWRFLVLNSDWTGFDMVQPKSGIPVSCVCEVWQNEPYLDY